MAKIVEIEVKEYPFTTNTVIENDCFKIDKDGIYWKGGTITRESILSILLNDTNKQNICIIKGE